nr:S8 family serine peptidase [uncultured Flavobacterium sp.]
MERYKVIVPRLNVRKAPVADFKVKNIITTVNEGLTLDLSEVFDVPNPSLGKWYTDGKGQFYSALGLQALENVHNIAVPKNFEFNPTIDHWWITDYGVDKIWKTTRGAGVKIAVIDSGLDYNHSNIKNKKNIEYYNAITGSSKKEDCIDDGYHGTKCAGMIAAQGPNIFGVAPEADLLIIRAKENGEFFNNLEKAITKAIELKSDIISISYDKQFKKDSPNYNALFNIIKKASEKNILIISSVGNTATTIDRYPASFIFGLSIGANNNENKISDFNTLNENLDLLAPGENVFLLDKDRVAIEDSGSSFSTPFVAGICALYLSTSKNKNIEFLKSALKTDSFNKDEIKETISKNAQVKIPNLGVINPLKLFNF